MLACLQPHLFVFANFSEYQFDYRKGRSTETALLDVLDRVYYTVADDQQVTAAFDTVDHEILLEHLQTEFGVTGILLSDLALWLWSHLNSRIQYDKMGQHQSLSLGLKLAFTRAQC